MDNYEKLLEEKIENAKNDLKAHPKAKWVSEEIDAYRDALNLYKNLKAKGEI